MINIIKILVANGRNDEQSIYITSCALSLIDEMIEQQPEKMKEKFGTHLFKCIDAMRIYNEQ